MSKAKELQQRIDELRKEIARASSAGASALNTHAILQSQAEITVLVGQLAEISTRRLVRLTVALLVLTAALLAVEVRAVFFP